MANLTYVIKVTEQELDADGEVIREHEAGLPHADLIAGAACRSWNSLGWEGLVGGALRGNISSAPMTATLDDHGHLLLVIHVRPVRGFRWSRRRRDAVWEELDAQLVDGWGEGFFGPVNPMADGDGNRFCAETA